MVCENFAELIVSRATILIESEAVVAGSVVRSIAYAGLLTKIYCWAAQVQASRSPILVTRPVVARKAPR